MSQTEEACDVFVRLYEHSDAVDCRRIRAQELKAAREEAEFQAQMVRLNNRAALRSAADIDAFYNNQMAWKHENDTRLLQKRREVLRAEVSSCRQPLISETSQEIISRMNYTDPVRGWSDRFTRYQAATSGRTPQRSSDEDHSRRTQSSSSFSLETSIRLYEDGERRRRSRKMLIDEHNVSVMSEATTHRTLSPGSRVGSRRTPKQASECLYQYASIQRENREKEWELHNALSEGAFTPRLSPRTRKMSPQRAPLYSTPQSPSPSSREPKGENKDPRQNSKTEASPAQSPSADTAAFLSRVRAYQVRKQNKLEHKRRLQVLQEASQCTFRPHISRLAARDNTSATIDGSGLSTVHGGSHRYLHSDPRPSDMRDRVNITGFSARSPVASSLRGGARVSDQDTSQFIREMDTIIKDLQSFQQHAV